MGCTQSKEETTPAPAAKQVASPAPAPSPCSSPTAAAAAGGAPAVLETPNEVTLGNISVRYAYASKRGNYPNDPNKANQDSFSVETQFAGKDSNAFFAVYDGHGEKGDGCSQFVRDNLPSLIAKGVKNGATTEDKLKTTMQWAHKTVNKKLGCGKAKVDCKWSGTTSVSMFLQGDENTITISNVGDSRAIIGSYEEEQANPSDGDLVATALSNDQTPWRPDERKRVTDRGGRILTEDQLFGRAPITEMRDDMVLGEEIDTSGQPPRVFSGRGDYPGLSVTRTIGDKVISDERVVDAEPELSTRVLTPQDKYLIVASDGVWEFMKNQEVLDMCVKAGDPLSACKAVIDKSYELWMKNDDRSDDITMICIFIDDVKPVEG